MLDELMRRAEPLARKLQHQEILLIAAQLEAQLDAASVEVEEARVLVRGRGIVKRWLIDPSLRFLFRGLK